MYFAKTTKGFIAVTPFDTQDIQVKTTVDTGGKKYGVARVENLSSTIKLEVVLPSEDGRFNPGDIVMVDGNLAKAPWAAATLIQELEGKKFIVAPDNIVKVIIQPKYKNDSVSST